jgi:nicotinamide mononucleotide transporter
MVDGLSAQIAALFAHPFEWIAVLLGIINIALLVRRSVWNYPFGLVMVCLYAVIFYEQKFYSDMLLQGFFFALQAYGWVHWQRSNDGAPIAVRTLSRHQMISAAAATTLAWLGWSTLMWRMTDAAAPYADGAVAMASVAAQLLLARRYIENWPVWIFVDILAIGLFASRGLTLTALLYGLFLVMSIIGWRQWRRAGQATDKAVFA